MKLFNKVGNTTKLFNKGGNSNKLYGKLTPHQSNHHYNQPKDEQKKWNNLERHK